jgi:hypothetical protein
MRLAIAVAVLSLSRIAMAGDLEGTWKLNSEKSKLQTDNYASDIIRMEQIAPLSYRFTYDVVLKTGQRSHSEVVRTFDGKSRPAPGAEGITEIDDHPDDLTWRIRRLKQGKVIDERSAIVDSAGKIQTVQRTTVTDSGEIVREVLVFEKQ